MRGEILDWCHHHVTGVPDGHSCDVRIVLVGEAGGKNEALQKKPFVGMAGQHLKDVWKQVGLSRDDLYITNVLDFQPENNDLSKVPRTELETAGDELIARLRRRVKPNVIVPTGATALFALTGQRQITKWRGSILWSDALQCKVIPTLHPAFVLREPLLRKTEVFDWARVADDSKFPEPRWPERNHIIWPTASRRKAFQASLTPETKLAIDIETSPDGIICVGFAASPHESLTVMFKDHYDFIKGCCEHPCEKILQNGLYDLYWLHFVGIEVCNFVWDVGCMWHALDPNAGPTAVARDAAELLEGRSRIRPYSMAYMQSVFTRQPYHKDSAKDEGEFLWQTSPTGEKLDKLLQYNGLDCCVTWELYDVLRKRLESSEVV